MSALSSIDRALYTPSPNVVSESSSSTESSFSATQSLFLEGMALQRLRTFFADRNYQYRATLNAEDGAKEVEFTLPLVPYLKKTWDALKERVSLKGVFLKGGATHYVFTGDKKPLPDLDLVIEIEKPKDWNEVELGIFNALGRFAHIDWFQAPMSNGTFQRTYFYKNKKNAHSN